MVAFRLPGPEDIASGGVTRDPGVRANPAAFGSDVAQAQASVAAAQMQEAQALEKVGQAAVHVGAYMDRKREAASAAIAGPTATGEAQQQLDQLNDTLAKSGVPKSAFEYGTNFREKSQGVIDKVHSDTVSRFNLNDIDAAKLRGHLLTLQNQYISSGVSWANNVLAKDLQNQTDVNVKAIAERAAQSGDIDSGLKAVDVAVDALKGAVSPDLIDPRRLQARQEVVDSVYANLKASGREEEAKALVTRFYGGVSQRLAPQYVEAIKTFEGFSPNAKWDYKQFSSGYGTRATYSGEPIDRATAETRLNTELGKAADIVDRVNPNLPPGPRAALISLTFNAGADWTKQELGARVREGDLAGAKQKLLEYNKAGGQTLPGLVERRQNEAAWFEGAQPKVAAGGGGPEMPDFEKAVKLRNALEVSQSQHAAQDAALIEKQRKQVGEEYMKEALNRASTKALTDDFIEQARPYLSHAEYQALLKTQRDEPPADDPRAVSDLVRRVDTDDPEQFQKLAGSYMEQGKLKTTTFTSLSEKNRTAAKDDQPASPYRSGRDLVKTALEPGLLVQGAARAPLAAAQAQALTEFDNWAAGKPQGQMSRPEAIAAAQDVVRRYQIVPFGEMKIAIGTSVYFGTKTREQITLDDVTAADQRLRDDILNARLTKAQADLEITRLNNWRGVLSKEQEAQQAAKEPTSGRKQR